MHLTHEDLLSIVDYTWQTMLCEEPDSPRLEGEPMLLDDDLVSSVAISGSWNGQLVVFFEPACAERVACGLLDAKPGELEEAEIQDAVCEIANILGGNLKPALPQPSGLGLPECGAEARREFESFAGEPEIDLNFHWAGHRFRVSLMVVPSSLDG